MRTECFTFVVQRSGFASGQVSPDLEKQLSLFFFFFFLHGGIKVSETECVCVCVGESLSAYVCV